MSYTPPAHSANPPLSLTAAKSLEIGKMVYNPVVHSKLLNDNLQQSRFNAEILRLRSWQNQQAIQAAQEAAQALAAQQAAQQAAAQQQAAVAAQEQAQAAAQEAAQSNSDMLQIFELESGNNPAAQNTVGCIGLGQDCDGRLQIDCPDWQTDYACQVSYFTSYMESRYGSWANALAFHLANGWW